MRKSINNLKDNQSTTTDDKSDNLLATKIFVPVIILLFSFYGIKSVLPIIRKGLSTEPQDFLTPVLIDEKGIIQVMSNPEILAWDGEFLWVTENNQEEKTAFLLQVDPKEGQIVGKLEVDWRPFEIIWDGKQLWITNLYTGTIQRINPDPLEVLNTYQIYEKPQFLTWDGKNLWLNCWDRRTLITRIDGKSGEITLEFEIEEFQKIAIDISCGEDSIWILNEGWKFNGRKTNKHFSLTQLNSNTGMVLKDFPLNMLSESGTAYLSWDGNNLWVAGKDVILKLDPETGTVLDTLIYDGLPGQLTWDGVNLWLFNRRSKSILQIDPVQLEIQNSFPTYDDHSSFVLDGTNLWINNGFWIQRYTPSKINLTGTPSDFTWANGQIWIVYGLYDDYGSIQSFDPETHLFGPTTSISDEPAVILYDGKNFWVTDWQEDIVQQVSPYENRTIVLNQIDVGSSPDYGVWDGTHIWIVSNDSASKIDPKSGQVISEIYTDRIARGITYDGDYLWVIVTDPKQVKKINPNTNKIENSYSIPMDWEAEHITWVGDSFWVDGAQRYDPYLGAKLDYVDLYCGPDDLVWDGEFLWAACDGQNVVLKLDAHTGQSLVVINVESPLRLLAIDDQIWVASRETIQQINTQSLDYLTSLWQ